MLRFAFAAELSLSLPLNFGMTSPSPSPSASAGAIAGSVLPLRRAEDLIHTLPGVLSARIVPNETGAIEEIHVLTTDQVLPKHTVRNIESALMAQLGLRVNHRKVSIATTLDAPRAADLPAAAGSSVSGGMPATPRAAEGAPAANAAVAVAGTSAPMSGVASSVARGGRERAEAAVESSVPGESRPVLELGRRLLIFEDVEVRRSRTRGVTCLVTLSREGQTYVGEAEGQEAERTRIELAARATVQAIAASRGTAGAVGSARGLGLEGATLITAFDREFVFVSLAVRMGREPVVLTGSCEVRENAETSAVLAVLDATNRWLYLDR